jgi:RNA polymerase sigma factor (sigma-70 family)
MNYKDLLSNQELFDAFRRGDQRAFSEIYRCFKIAIYAFTIRMVGEAEKAEDLTVQSFVRVWERRESIESMAHLKNFLYIAARNSSINYLRERRRSQLELTSEIAEEADTYHISRYETDQLFTDLVEDIMLVVKKMPKLRGIVFRMRYLEERSVKEVADTLQLSIQNVYWHTSEALAQVRGALLKKAPIPSKVFSLLLMFVSASLITANS